MSFFAGKYLVALGFVTALQILSSQPSLASLQSSDSARTLPKATAAASIEMLTDAEGVDLGPSYSLSTGPSNGNGCLRWLRQSRKGTKE
jgi:hypothetical protein